MVTVIVVAEGQTEETFVHDVLAPSLAGDAIYLEPRLIRTSRYERGGAVSYPRVLRYLRNTLRQRGDTYVTTFFDLYGLDKQFPGYDESRRIRDPLAQAAHLAQHLHATVVQEVGCRPERFIAYIQPYEFEALLFADVARLIEIEPEWAAFARQLREIREKAPSPEHINDGQQTHPSARLQHILRPRYRKTLHGPLATQAIGLPRIKAECRHFAQWLNQLRSLRPLNETRDKES